MASEDVIELGSSEDETEPAPKKIKPMPNAMVHIPRKLHDVTIKPAKLNISSAIPKELAGKNVTVTKISRGINVLANPYAMKNKPNGKQLQIKPVVPKQLQIPQRQVLPYPHVSAGKKPVLVQNKTVNPLSIINKINSQVVINKVPSTPKVLKNAIRIQSPRTINNLPPSITVTRTAGSQKRVAPVNIANPVRKKQKRNNIPKTTTGEVLTVDLDEDEVSSSSTASPQWYLRPEEQTTSKSIEEENNTEPEPSKSNEETVEITIEDSPIKPIKDKRICTVSSELTVTIDDSPVKNAVEKNSASGSDGEAKTVNIVPHSKKKLEYPKEAEGVSKVVEIEISPMNVAEVTGEVMMAESGPSNEHDNNIIEIEESPLKVQGQGTSTPKKNHPQPKLAVPESIKELEEAEGANVLSEFHPVYQSFINLCFQLENSEDMKKIVEKKIKTYYRQVPKEYTESEEFIDMVAGKVLSMKAGPEKMYLYIKDIVDELNLQRKIAKAQVISNLNEKKSGEADKYYYDADSEYDSKRQRQIRKLEKTLKKLHRAIQKLEDQEVDFDDEEDSVYLLTESDEGSSSNKDSDRQLEKDPKALLQRYKERMVRVHAKFCQLTNTKMPSEPRVQIDARPGQATGPAKRLEKWINKKVPIGTPLPFPDFHDVLRCVREANDEDKLGWNEADIMEEARDLFTRCGKKLQRRRQENEWRIAASRISVEVDPAEKSQDLKKKLDDNKKVAAKKESEVFNKFADRQSQLKLEAEEIGDKEAEESPGDDDDEEEDLQNTNESSLENKEKRKERLKRLLHEKSKKLVEQTETKDDNKACPNESENLDKVDKMKSEAAQLDKDVKNNSENGVKIETQKDSKTDSQKDDNPNMKEIELTNKDEDVQKLSDNKDVSENESVKSDDSDTVEIVPNKKDDIHILKVAETQKDQSKNTDETLYHNASVVEANVTDSVDKAQSISDDSSNKLESDVDELHLLQKLHSENEVNTSTLESSDSETPIAISDTLGSSSDNNKRASSDVISIENSSYSESEMSKELSDFKDTFKKTNKIVEEIVDANIELECSNNGIEKKQPRTNNDEYNESIEDILLASTDDEVENDKTSKPVEDEECVNLKDDTLSIGDTVVEGTDKKQVVATDSNCPGKQDDASSVDSVPCVSFKDDSIAQTNMDVDSQDDNSGNVTENTDKVNKQKETETIDKSEDINSIESENSVQSINMIELKESSSEKEMEVVEECTNTLDSEERADSVEEVMDTTEEPINKIQGEEKGNTMGEISDAIVDTANSQDSNGKDNSPEEKVTANDESMKCLPSVTTTDESPEPPKDNSSDKL